MEPPLIPDMPDNDSSAYEETDSDRQRGLLAEDALSLDMVSALSGDRQLTDEESGCLRHIQRDRHPRFYSDILYCITHQYFAPEVAEDLWREILHHKQELSKILGRNTGIVVAALDYLTNMTGNMQSTTLVGEEHIEEIVGLSLRDGLTGLFNHTYFYQQLDMEMRRFLRYSVPLSLILIDIDDFKIVNDRYGHREGDRVLSTLATTLQHVARDSDICCRYGGEEFSVILPLTDLHAASEVADRLETEMVERLPCEQIITTSMGVAACGTGTGTCRALVEKADAALYQAKRNGKARVIVA